MVEPADESSRAAAVPRFKRSPEALWRVVAGGVLVASPAVPEPLRLDGVGALLFLELESESGWPELTAALDDRFGSEWRSDESAVGAFLDQLVDLGLLERSGDTSQVSGDGRV